MEILLVYPENKRQTDAIKAVMEAMNIRFESKDETISVSLSAVERSVSQINLFKKGKIKATPAREFLAELKKELDQ